MSSKAKRKRRKARQNGTPWSRLVRAVENPAASGRLLGGTEPAAMWLAAGVVPMPAASPGPPAELPRREHGRRRGGGAGSGTGGGRSGNAQVFLCAHPRPETVGSRTEAVRLTAPTSDPADRAHDARDHETNFLVPAAKAGPRAVPRRYPPGQLVDARDRSGRVVGRVSIDTAADALYEAQCRLLAEFGDVPGITPASDGTVDRHSSRDLERQAARWGGGRGMRSRLLWSGGGGAGGGQG